MIGVVAVRDRSTTPASGRPRGDSRRGCGANPSLTSRIVDARRGSELRSQRAQRRKDDLGAARLDERWGAPHRLFLEDVAGLEVVLPSLEARNGVAHSGALHGQANGRQGIQRLQDDRRVVGA
jgi:hypothetical protein